MKKLSKTNLTKSALNNPAAVIEGWTKAYIFKPFGLPLRKFLFFKFPLKKIC